MKKPLEDEVTSHTSRGFAVHAKKLWHRKTQALEKDFALQKPLSLN